MKNQWRILLISLFGMFCIGCASTSQTRTIPKQDVRLDDSSKARIYVMRPSAIGGAVKFRVFDNDERVGKLGPEGYLCWERVPGVVKVTAGILDVNLRTEADKVYYVLLRAGFTSFSMEQVDEKRGQEYLKDCSPPNFVKKKD